MYNVTDFVVNHEQVITPIQELYNGREFGTQDDRGDRATFVVIKYVISNIA